MRVLGNTLVLVLLLVRDNTLGNTLVLEVHSLILVLRLVVDDTMGPAL